MLSQRTTNETKTGDFLHLVFILLKQIIINIPRHVCTVMLTW